jgi:hypothetical protein
VGISARYLPFPYRGGADKLLTSTSYYLQPVDPTCEAQNLAGRVENTFFQNIQGAFLEPENPVSLFY